MTVKIIIGGEPHSGKSTVISMLRDRLCSRGIDVELLDLDLASPTICYLYSGNERARCKKMWNSQLGLQAQQKFNDAKADVILADSVGKITEITEMITEPADSSIVVSTNSGNIEKWGRFYKKMGKPVLANIESSQGCVSHFDLRGRRGRICDVSREKYIAGKLAFDPVIELLTDEIIEAFNLETSEKMCESITMGEKAHGD